MGNAPIRKCLRLQSRRSNLTFTRFCSREKSDTLTSPVRGGRGASLTGSDSPSAKATLYGVSSLSIRLINAVVENAPVHGGEYLLLICMARYAADDGTRVFPAVGTLARDTRQDQRSVHRQLRSLEEKGLIVRVGVSRHSTVNYRVAIEKLSTGGDDLKPSPVTVRPPTPDNHARTPDRRPPDSLSNTSLNRQNPDKKIQEQIVKTEAGEQALQAIRDLLKSKPLFKGMP